MKNIKEYMTLALTKGVVRKTELDREFEAGRKLAEVMGIERKLDSTETKRSRIFTRDELADRLCENKIAETPERSLIYLKFLAESDWIGNSKLTEYRTAEGVVYILEIRTNGHYRA